MKNNFLFVCFIFLCSNSYANDNLDSLWSLWNNEFEEDTIRAEALYKYARDGYLYSNPDSTYYYAELLYAFSNKNGLNKEMGRALNLQGVSFQMRSDFINALKYYNKALGILDINNDPKGLNWCYQNVGNVYSQQGNYIKADPIL